MWPNPQQTVDLLTFTKEILKGKLYFLYNSELRQSIPFLETAEIKIYYYKV